MINCSKLLDSQQTLNEISRCSQAEVEIPKWALRFTKVSSPMVVWNITQRCNLSCVHCYISAGEQAHNELTHEEAKEFIRDLAQMKVPLLVFSGGEPLLRPDIYDLNIFALSQGLRTILSTNGTLITPTVARLIKDSGFAYAGVSLDGVAKVNDKFRGREGCFQSAVEGLRNLKAAGVKTGVRFAITQQNYAEIPKVLELVKQEGIPRFSLFQLVYAGRGKDLIPWDISNELRRHIIQFILRETAKCQNLEVVTADNYADGIFLLEHIAREQPHRAAQVEQLLAMQSGCPAGDKLVNVDNRGFIHLCPYWQHRSLGNIRERPLSQIWLDETPGILGQMRDKVRYLKGKCGRCRFNNLCRGCRVRAEVAYGDAFAEDPACYLTEEEIGAKGSLQMVTG